MNMLDIEVIAIAMVTACACVIPGVFLVLRGVALMTDAISHAVLLGIVLLFLVVHDLHSPLLMIGASATGIITVLFTEWIIKTHCLKKDAAIGLIYPLFFSLGVLLISCYARNAHLDLDMVFLGDLAYAPFNRCYIAGYDCGPVGLITMGTILSINALFSFLFYKELTISIFDPTFAILIGIQPYIFYYALMLLTCITTVGAFDVVGAIVVIALMITPPATALLLTTHLPKVIALSIAASCIASLFGYYMAALGDFSIAGSIATMSGICFLLALLFSPLNGLIIQNIRTKKDHEDMLKKIFYNFAKDKEYITYEMITQELGWSAVHFEHVFKVVNSGEFLLDRKNNIVMHKK